MKGTRCMENATAEDVEVTMRYEGESALCPDCKIKVILTKDDENDMGFVCKNCGEWVDFDDALDE